MKEKKQIKINLLLILLLAFTIIILTFLSAFFLFNSHTASKDYKKVYIGGKVYYQKLTKNTWNGEYHQDIFYTDIHLSKNIMKVVSYPEYVETIDSINNQLNRSEISKYYSNQNCNYIILSYSNGYSFCEMELIDCISKKNKITIYGDESIRGNLADGTGFFIAIPTNMPVGTEIEYIECYSSSEIRNIKKYGVPYNPKELSCDKPIIYLYPEEEINLTIELGNSDNITCSYPKYETGWNILAKPNGDLIDIKNGKKLYALYYESKAIYNPKVEKDGFIVSNENLIEFLEEKLSILGLTERESEEFIVYWLPKMQENKYNYVRFATLEEINRNMPLNFSIEPDTLIRILMTYKGLDNPIDVQEQHLETPERTGFVAVEWGGTEIK